MNEAEKAYQVDPHFRSLVDALIGHLNAHDFAPCELRMATTLAMVKFESMRPPAGYVYQEKETK